MTKWSGAESRGYGLFINEEGCLSFRLGDGEGSIVEVSSEVPLHRWVWYFVAASFERRLQDGSPIAGTRPSLARPRAA